jgi:hypothetical protein
MGLNERRGARKNRDKNRSTRVPKLGYYLIVTDTEETEKNYFEGLRDSIPEELKSNIVIRVYETKTVSMVEKCRELRDKDPQYRIPWLVFDKDQVDDFDNIIYTAKKNDINVGWSNPCIEIWFMAYLGEMPSVNDSISCCRFFKDKLYKLGKIKYKKSDKNIYRHLNKYGDEENAIAISEKKHLEFINDCIISPSKMCPSSTLHILVGEIKSKIEEQ